LHPTGLAAPLTRRATMPRQRTAAVLLLIVPPLARAQEGPERLLPVNSQIYVRWDGHEKHQAAFDKTAVARLLQGGLKEALTDLLADKKHLHLLRLVRALASQGMIVGLELRSIQQDAPDAQLVVVLPNGKTQWDALFGTMTWVAEKEGMQVKEGEVQGRTVYQVQGTEPVHV